MNGSRLESVELASALAQRYPTATEGVEIAVCPPAVYLDAVQQALQGTAIRWGAQNMYQTANGAFTGEISAAMLLDLGCHHVILGHSERRALMGETDAQINVKTLAALENGLFPIVCVGESLEQRESGQTQQVVAEQFENSLAGLAADQITRVVIAYEPVWAIGTGKVATPEQAEAVHDDLRKMLENRYDSSISDRVQILYGGSVKPGNAAELLSQPNVDGALVGGASLKADDFSGIIQAACDLANASD